MSTVFNIFAIVAMVAVLVLMAFDPETQSQITLGLGSWAALLIVFFLVVRTRKEYQDQEPVVGPDAQAERILVLANADVASAELVEEVDRVQPGPQATFYVAVPANPVEVGTALTSGAVWIDEETRAAAQRRLDRILQVLTERGYTADGEVGPFDVRATLDGAVLTFKPDAIVIATAPDSQTAWLRDDTVAKARERYSVPVYHHKYREGAPAGLG